MTLTLTDLIMVDRRLPLISQTTLHNSQQGSPPTAVNRACQFQLLHTKAKLGTSFQGTFHNQLYHIITLCHVNVLIKI